MKAKWLFSKHPVVVDTDLAVATSLNEAVVLQQLNYWLHSKSAKVINNRRWIYNTYANWKKDNFPFWSTRTIRRTFNSLIKKKIVITGNFNRAGFDKTKWYSIDEDALNKLVDSACGQNGQSMRTKCPDGAGQNGHTYTRDYTENTTENTNMVKHSKESLTESKLRSDFEIVWSRYPNKKGKKEAFKHYKAWRKKSVKNTNDYLLKKLEEYKEFLLKNNWPEQYIMQGSTWFNGRFDDQLKIDNTKPENGGFSKDMLAKDLTQDQLKNDNHLPF